MIWTVKVELEIDAFDANEANKTREAWAKVLESFPTARVKVTVSTTVK